MQTHFSTVKPIGLVITNFFYIPREPVVKQLALYSMFYLYASTALNSLRILLNKTIKYNASFVDIKIVERA